MAMFTRFGVRARNTEPNAGGGQPQSPGQAEDYRDEMFP